MSIAALLCMAEAVYFEARSEPIEAQFAVAQVVANRIADSRYPDDACRVVHDRCQFSYWCDGKSEVIRNRQAWGVALYVATTVTLELLPDITGGATHYHAQWITPYWATTEGVTLGSQVFHAL